MIKYRASVSSKIEIKEIIKETKNFVVFEADKEWFKNGERRESKESEYHKYFNDFSAAKKWLIDMKVELIKNLELKLENERVSLSILDAMKDD